MKVINDPVYGYIRVTSPLVLSIIEHPTFQRLRRIQQLGVSDYVYPGALHTRFQHALGAMSLAEKALNVLKNKGTEISKEESEACQLAVLLHDIGHGPFSHSLEEVLIPEIRHETISYHLMVQLNKEFDNKLDLALQIFRNSYDRSFFHELVNSQLDMDRLDYLHRDSFFTGVPEGKINVERIIQLLGVHEDKLVVEPKAMYSIENFLNARRLMYWQVYLHKTSLGVDRLLVNIISRAKDLVSSGVNIQGSEHFIRLLSHPPDPEELSHDHASLKIFSNIDDYDVIGSIKLWVNHSDKILSILCRMFLERNIFKVELRSNPIEKEEIMKLKALIAKKYNVLNSEAHFFFSHGRVTNEAYLSGGSGIHVLQKNGQIIDIAEAADLPNIQAMKKLVSKYYICQPKKLIL